MVTFFAEVFEKILYNHTSKFLDRNGSIHENQFGFRKGRGWVGGGGAVKWCLSLSTELEATTQINNVIIIVNSGLIY